MTSTRPVNSLWYIRFWVDIPKEFEHTDILNSDSSLEYLRDMSIYQSLYTVTRRIVESQKWNIVSCNTMFSYKIQLYIYPLNVQWLFDFSKIRHLMPLSISY